jgi:hypothetical protein
MRNLTIGLLAIRHGDLEHFESFLIERGFTPETTESSHTVLTNYHAEKRIFEGGMLQNGMTIMLVDSRLMNKQRVVKYWLIKI